MSSSYQTLEFIFNFNHLIIQCPNKKDIELSIAEANILHKMIENQEVIFSNNELENIGWPDKPVGLSNLTVVISSLRKKITPINSISIKNIPRKGYLLTSKEKIVKLENLKKIETVKNSIILARVKTKNIDIHLSNLFHIFLLILNISLLVLIVLSIIPKHNFKCDKFKNKTICSIGYQGYNNLNLSTHIDDNQILLKTPENTIIIDKYSNILLRVDND